MRIGNAARTSHARSVRRASVRRLCAAALWPLLSAAMLVAGLGTPVQMTMQLSGRMSGMAMSHRMPMSAAGDFADSTAPHEQHPMPKEHEPCTCPGTSASCVCMFPASPALPAHVTVVAMTTFPGRTAWHFVGAAPVPLTAAPTPPPPKA